MAFKRCTKCGVEWGTREAFLADPCVYICGYQVNYADLEAGLFLFTHRGGSCGTTMATPASSFIDMHQGPMFEKSLRGTPECLGLCGRSDALDRCPAKCECGFVRDVLQEVRCWTKSPACMTAVQGKDKA